MIEVEGPDGTVFEFPPDTPQSVIRDAMRKRFGGPDAAPKPPSKPSLRERTDRAMSQAFPVVTGEREVGDVRPAPAIARGVGLFAGGFNRGAAEAATAVPEAVASGMRYVGLPAPGPGFYSGAAKDAMAAVIGQPLAPDGSGERFIAGMGEGAANAASVLLPATAVANASKAGTVTNAVANALAAQPGVQVASSMAGQGVADATDSPLAGIGAALATPVAATAAQGAYARAVAPVANALDPRRQQLVDLLRSEGVDLRPSQATGSKTLRQIEETVGRFPGAIDRFAAQRQQQQQQFTRAVSRRMGENVDAVTPDVLAGARARIGSDFDSVSARTAIAPDAQLASEIQATVANYAQQLPAQQKPQFGRYVDNLMDFVTAPNGPSMDGKSYQTIRSQLTREIQGLNGPGSDKRYQDALIGIRDALDGAFARSVGPNDVALYRQARGQWSAMRTAESAVAGNGGGDLTPSALAQAVMSRRRDQYARSLGQLDELAKAGKEVLPAQIPNSGTPERAFWLGALLTPAAAIPAAGGANLAQRALESRAVNRWLTNERPEITNFVTPEMLAAVLAANRNNVLPAGREAGGYLPAR